MSLWMSVCLNKCIFVWLHVCVCDEFECVPACVCVCVFSPSVQASFQEEASRDPEVHHGDGGDWARRRGGCRDDGGSHFHARLRSTLRRRRRGRRGRRKHSSRLDAGRLLRDDRKERRQESLCGEERDIFTLIIGYNLKSGLLNHNFEVAERSERWKTTGKSCRSTSKS